MQGSELCSSLWGTPTPLGNGDQGLVYFVPFNAAVLKCEISIFHVI